MGKVTILTSARGAADRQGATSFTYIAEAAQ
jgi:hypothetical protein